MHKLCLAEKTTKYKEYYNPLKEEKIRQGLKDWYERTNLLKKTEKTKTKNKETIIKKKQKNIIRI